jgi:hypothetical protein
MKNQKQIKPEEIQSRIYTIRGVQVMLDKDLAILYDVKPIRLREQVKRNIKHFPSDFMFQITEEEVNLMVSQNAIPSKQHLGGAYTKEKSIAKQAASQFETKIVQQVVAQLTQNQWGQNITKNLPDEFRSSLPSIEEIEAELSGGKGL